MAPPIAWFLAVPLNWYHDSRNADSGDWEKEAYEERRKMAM
jgi:hypothetical protein